MATSKNNQPAQANEQQLSQNEEFFLKYKNAIIGCIVALVVIVCGVVLYKNYYKAPLEDKASTAIAKAQDLFQARQYERALQGDSLGTKGFLAIASEFSSTDAGNLANLYAGLCYAQLNQWQEAVNYLEKFSTKSDQMISPASEAALGNAYAHLNNLEKAVKHLVSAAEKADNNTLSPTFLIQAGEILESQGKKSEALKLYQKIKTKYVKWPEYATIDKYIERVSE